MKKYQEQIELEIDSELLKKLNIAAQKEGTSLAQYIRDVITQWILHETRSDFQAKA